MVKDVPIFGKNILDKRSEPMWNKSGWKLREQKDSHEKMLSGKILTMKTLEKKLLHDVGEYFTCQGN